MTNEILNYNNLGVFQALPANITATGSLRNNSTFKGNNWMPMGWTGPSTINTQICYLVPYLRFSGNLTFAVTNENHKRSKSLWKYLLVNPIPSQLLANIISFCQVKSPFSNSRVARISIVSKFSLDHASD